MKSITRRKQVTHRKNISGLIRIALADLIECEKDPRYRIDMDDWHVPNSHCAVCLAGAVMAKTIKLPISQTVTFFDYHDNNDHRIDTLDQVFSPLLAQQFVFLDSIRLGTAREAWDSLDIDEPYPLKQDNYDAPSYRTDPVGAKAAMRRMADRFEKAGY
jgi:hypothetical protein